MAFEPTPRVQELMDRLTEFMHEHIYPNEPIYDEQDLREIAQIRQEIRKGAAYEVIRAIPKNPPRLSRLHEHHKGFKNFYFSIYRGAWGEPAPTLTASGNGPGGRAGLLHPDEDAKWSTNDSRKK